MKTAKDLDYVCKCNKCGDQFVDPNPSDASIKVDVSGMRSLAQIGGGGEDLFWGCPVCESDGYLQDVTAAGAERLYNVVSVRNDNGAKTKLNATPMPHKEACTFKSKCPGHAGFSRTELEQTTGQTTHCLNTERAVTFTSYRRRNLKSVAAK